MCTFIYINYLNILFDIYCSWKLHISQTYLYLHVCMYLHVCVLLQIMAQFYGSYLCVSTCMYAPTCMCFIADYGLVLWFIFMCIYMYVFYCRLWHSFMVHIYVDKLKVITREGRILLLSYEEKELEDFIMWQVNNPKLHIWEIDLLRTDEPDIYEGINLN